MGKEVTKWSKWVLFISHGIKVEMRKVIKSKMKGKGMGWEWETLRDDKVGKEKLSKWESEHKCKSEKQKM